MTTPKLIHYNTEQEYKKHYERVYCKKPIISFDSIPIVFRKNRFEHAFYESSQRNNIKDQFSNNRAERIDWIIETLTNPKADLYCGWDKKKRKNDPNCRVSVVYGNYVVIVRLKRTQSGLSGEFVTAYLADNSIQKIRGNPKWEINLV
ncbi:MAG: hypothetical protein COV66_08175 [Nitrospinae bacterium CG11_big_fil_rev_8_21_14_0_20_45_15]|nr:MAG: hypothetical protein COV66_08175 [Nitrospinae bacterium CG11_big_fil_rev_8_21_14_0_20_45_15]